MHRALDVITVVLAALGLLALAVLAVRGMREPAIAAQAFGMPAGDGGGAFYHAVYRSRNLALAVIGLLFLLLRMWRAAAILCSVALLLPAYDLYALHAAGAAAPPLHGIILGVLLVLSALLWRMALRTPMR